MRFSELQTYHKLKRYEHSRVGGVTMGFISPAESVRIRAEEQQIKRAINQKCLIILYHLRSDVISKLTASTAYLESMVEQ